MHSPPCILIVDDNPINIKLLEKSLARDRYKIIKGTDGNEGYDLAVSEIPDLILLDIMMPEKDGYEVCKLLKEKEETSAIPVIFITAMAEISSKIKGLDIGAVDYITKPFNSVEVLARVRTQLKLKKMHEENINYQKYLLGSQKMASIGILSEGVAHNFNNLLSVITCYSDLLKGSSSEKESRYIEKIQSTALRMDVIIKQLLEFSRRDEILPDTMDASSFIQKVVNSFKESLSQKEQFEITLDLHLSNEKIFGDRRQLFQAFLNILLNAREAMQYGGKIKITTQVVSTEKEELKKKLPYSSLYVSISIQDTGRGIEKADLEKIFLPFFTTKSTVGVGLGLSTSYGIIKNHKGNILVESEVNKGSKFTVYLPVYEIK